MTIDIPVVEAKLSKVQSQASRIKREQYISVYSNRVLHGNSNYDYGTSALVTTFANV